MFLSTEPPEAACVPAAASLARPALAQGRYPDRPIRVYVPWTPGGATDIVVNDSHGSMRNLRLEDLEASGGIPRALRVRR